MRIKSYFSPSVQSAIALARVEFGDNITLVTSHASSLENRHLGEYEVVFAVEPEDESPVPEPAAPAAHAFRDLLEEAIQTKPSPQENLPEKIEQIRSLLVEMGIEPPMVRALMTMVERCVSIPGPIDAQNLPPAGQRPEVKVDNSVQETEVTMQTSFAVDLRKRYTPAELAFVQSMSDPAKDTAALTPKWALGS